MMIHDALEKKLESNEEYKNIFRPSKMSGFIGNKKLVDRLELAVTAAKERNDPVDHILLTGAPGLGKTTIANLVAEQYETEFRAVNAAALTKPQDLIETLVQIEDNAVILLDECHAVTPKMAENIYTAMEDFKITIKLGNKQPIELNTKKFCLIGATTHPGKMPEPLRDRFGIHYTMEYYSDKEIESIVKNNFKNLEVDIQDTESIEYIAKCSRGIPRISNKLVKRIRDYAQVHNNNTIDIDLVKKTLKDEELDAYGFNKLDRQYMKTLFTEYNGGPCGPKSIATSMGQDTTTITESIEPFLIRKKYVTLTPRGRCLAGVGVKFLQEALQEGIL